MLARILEEFGCQTGTIHRATESGDMLSLVEHVGVPDFLFEKISLIPFGKGIAGAAAERKEPVELCNLQENLGGIAKPDAQKTGVSGSIAVPIFSPDSSEVIGTLGIGKFAPYEFTPVEKQRLHDLASSIAAIFQHKQD
jgi:L-methionine (R)-S-oxide reductase